MWRLSLSYGFGFCSYEVVGVSPKSQLPGEDRMTRASFRILDEDWEEFDDWCDHHDTNRSEALRQFIAEKVAAERDDDPLPSDPTLSKAMQALRAATDPEGVLPVSVGKSRTAEVTRYRQQDVRRCVLDPLQERGWIVVDNGRIMVSQP